MKKIALMAVAALAMICVACGDKKAGNGENSENSENGGNEAAYITYTNDKFGYSLEVPNGLFQGEQATNEDGTLYLVEEGGTVFNSISVSGGKHIFDEDYTPEKVKAEYEEEMEGKEQVASQECGDDYYTYTIKGDYCTEIHRNVYSGPKRVYLTICFDADHEKQLGGEVAEHIMSSLKFK